MAVSFDNLKKDFWKGEYKGQEYVFNDDGIEIAIWRAIRDFTFRTEKRVEESVAVIEKVTEEVMFEKLNTSGFVKGFIDYFHAPAKDKAGFDKWHKKMCNDFLDALSDIYQNLAYGKAQKIVNMTFKNAYCLPDDKNSEIKKDDAYFKYCHMPLDRFTLEWFKRNIKVRGKNFDAWSKLQSEDTLKDDKKYTYEEITNAIRNYFYSEENMQDYLKGLTPFQAEFFIWKYIQFEEAAESIYKAMTSFDGLEKNELKKEINNFKAKNINDKLDFLHEKFNGVKKYKV